MTADVPVTLALPIAERAPALAFYRDALGLEPFGDELGSDGIPEPLQFAVNEGLTLMLVPTGGFGWVIGDDRAQSVFAFLRFGAEEGQRPALVVCNMTPVPRHGYRIGVPRGGGWREALNTDGAAYGGTDTGNGGYVRAEPLASHGFDHSLPLVLPPLATLILLPEG